MSARRIAEVREWAFREWNEQPEVVELGEVRLRYFVPGRRIDGSVRNPEAPGDGDFNPGGSPGDDLFGVLFAILLAALLYVIWIGFRAFILLLGRTYRQNTASVRGKNGDVGVRFADAMNQRQDVYFVRAGKHAALLYARPKWIEVLWTGEWVPKQKGRKIRWPDGSQVILPQREPDMSVS